MIHTVGPRFNVKYQTAADNALHGCYRNVLRLMKEAGLVTIAIPCIYADDKGYPRREAAHIAIRTCAHGRVVMGSSHYRLQQPQLWEEGGGGLGGGGGKEDRAVRF